MELYYVVTILDRNRAGRMIKIYEESGLTQVVTLLAHGTALHEHLSLYGLEKTDKALVTSVADATKTAPLYSKAKHRMMIDIPGNGVMLSIPIKSLTGGRTLSFLTNDAPMDKGVPAMEFAHELILIILNQGFTDDVMDAARSAGASGGTILHARGTGAEYARKFLGVSLAEEKEIILIVATAKGKNAILKAVAEQTGIETPAGAIAFSLPVSDVAGLRALDEEDAEG